MRHQAVCFPPIVANGAHTLILGSMPGRPSLKKGEYYAFPQNSFWKIMSRLFKGPAATYPERVGLILENKLALWDVLEECERENSDDQGIDDATIKVNDFASFLASHKKVERIFFNGTRAEKEFKRRVLPKLPEKTAARIKLCRLLSTSPLCRKTFEQKLKDWKVILPPII